MALAGGVAAGASLWLFAPRWWGWAPQAFSLWGDAQLWAWMAWSACAAWVVLPAVRGRLVDRQRVSARARAERIGRPLVTLAAWQAAASLVVLVGVLVLMQASTGIRWAFPASTLLWVASGVVIGWFHLALGTAAAAVTRHVAAVLVAPAAVYLNFLVPPYVMQAPRWDQLPVSMASQWTEEMPSLLSLAGRLVFWVGLLWLLVALLTRPRRARLHLAAAAVLTVTGVATVVVEGSRFVPIPGATDLVCTQSRGSEYCTTQIYAAGAPAVTAILNEGLAELPEDYRPARIASGQDSAPLLGDSAVVLTPVSADGIHSPTNLPDRAATLVLMGDELLGLGSCPSGSDTADETRLALRYWWRGQFGLAAHERYGISDYDEQQLYPPDVIARAQARAADFAALPEAERKRFLAEHRTDIQTCTLPADTIPGKGAKP